MRILKKALRMKCCWYEAGPNNGKNRTYKLPVECLCSWEDKSVVVHLRRGGEFMSNASVLMDRLVADGGYLVRMSLDDLKLRKDFADPTTIPEALYIEKTETVSTLKAKDYTDMKQVAHWVFL